MSPEGMILGGRYRVIKLIGSGGMADVYLATDLSSGMNVAIKILKPEFANNVEFIKRFDTEAKAASSLSHANIVHVFGVGQEGSIRYMVQEYVEGITVKELVLQNGHLDWKVAVPIVIQVGMALDTAHQNGIVHRDIKPHNILITRDRIAKVTDFGIAHASTNHTITLTSGGALGSVHYFSPEQARGGVVSPSSDIYSLGVTLFEMVTGRVPFDGETSVSIAVKHLQ
jgi:serine/threonine-protein kinase